MRVGLTVRQIQENHGRALRGVAIFFLLFAGADLAFPEVFCRAETGASQTNSPARVSVADDAISDSAHGALGRSDDSRHDGDSRQTQCDECCFCCCAHVLPGISCDGVPGVPVATTVIQPRSDKLPTPLLQNTYHPPRFA